MLNKMKLELIVVDRLQNNRDNKKQVQFIIQ